MYYYSNFVYWKIKGYGGEIIRPLPKILSVIAEIQTQLQFEIFAL
jgi:hypothetical protein